MKPKYLSITHPNWYFIGHLTVSRYDYDIYYAAINPPKIMWIYDNSGHGYDIFEIDTLKQDFAKRNNIFVTALYNFYIEKEKELIFI